MKIEDFLVIMNEYQLFSSDKSFFKCSLHKINSYKYSKIIILSVWYNFFYYL